MVSPKKSGNLEKLGKVSKAHGLEGFFYFKLPTHIKAGQTIFLGMTESSVKAFVLSNLRQHKGRTLVKLEGVHDRTALEPHLGSFLWCEKNTSEESLDHPHEGKEALCSEGTTLGLCRGFYNHGAGDVIVIEREDGFLLELPFNDTYFSDEHKGLQSKFPKSFFEDLWQKP